MRVEEATCYFHTQTIHGCRNHFVTALKLYACGKAKPRATDKQLKRHLEHGPVCQVMDERLYADEEGLSATQLPQAWRLVRILPRSRRSRWRLAPILPFPASGPVLRDTNVATN